MDKNSIDALGPAPSSSTQLGYSVTYSSANSLTLSVNAVWTSVCFADVPTGVWILDMSFFTASANSYLIQMGPSTVQGGAVSINGQAGPVSSIGTYPVHTSSVVTNTGASSVRWYMNVYSSSAQTLATLPSYPTIVMTRIG